VHVAGKNFVPGVTSVTVLKPAGGIEQRVDVRTVLWRQTAGTSA
jgi:hypothetical protein